MASACQPCTTGSLPPSFHHSLREFLTPAVWKQAQQAWPQRTAARTWTLPPLVSVLLALTWCTGDSLPERFETARAFYVATHQKRKRPGSTYGGFAKALDHLPVPVLRLLAHGLRRQLELFFPAVWSTGEFIAFGCDGTRLECPRTTELEQRLGCAGKADSAPTVWLTAIIHLRTGLLWSWRLGKGTASELVHLRWLLRTLPAAALLVADAGYVDYTLYATIADSGRWFLIRMSSRAYLYTTEHVELKRFREGLVYYWPVERQQKQLPPIEARLLRIAGKKADVWLLTNVLQRRRLGRQRASQLYRWRWRNEGLFRSYKRTLGKVKLQSRTVSLVHREAEGSLLAVQLLLAQGVLAQVRQGAVEVRCSVRGMVLAIRQDIGSQVGQHLGPRQKQRYQQRLAQARLEQRRRTSPKEARVWPRRRRHKAPKAPQIRTLTEVPVHKRPKGMKRILVAASCPLSAAE